MNDENKIGLSIEMYEDLKETLVKAVKSTKANAGLENAQLERIERLIEATELSQGQVAQMLEQLQRHTALPGVKTEQEREFTDKYNALLAQLAGRLEVIDKEIRQTHTLIEQVRQAVEAAVKPETCQCGSTGILIRSISVLRNIFDDVRHAGMYFPARRIHLPNLRE